MSNRTSTIVTLIGVVGAVLAALFTGWQAFVARDTEHRQLRAYLIVKSARFARNESGQLKFGKTYPDGRSSLLIYYDVSNEGITLAYDVFRRIDVEYSFAGEIQFNYTDGTAAYVSKEETFGPVITRPFTHEELAGIASGAMPPLLFAGEITYRDIFENAWPTNFGFIYAVTDAAPDQPSFIACPRWTDADRLNFAR